MWRRIRRRLARPDDPPERTMIGKILGCNVIGLIVAVLAAGLTGCGGRA